MKKLKNLFKSRFFGSILVIMGIFSPLAQNLFSEQLKETILHDYPWSPLVVLVITGVVLLLYAQFQSPSASENASVESGSNKSQNFPVSLNNQSGNNTSNNAPFINQPTGPIYINHPSISEKQKESLVNGSNLPDYIAQALNNIDNYDRLKREESIKILGEVADKYDEAREGLLKTLEHGLFDTRVQAAIELAKFGEKEAIPVLQEALLGTNEDFWKESADGLAAIGPESISTLETIINTLSNKQWIYQLIINALTTINTPESIEVIIKALDNKSFRGYAIEKLGELKDPQAIPALTKLLGMLDGTGGAVAGVLIRIGPKCVPGACKMLEEVKNRRDTETLLAAKWAAYILGHFQDPAGVLALIEALSDLEHSISQEARIALEKIGERRWKLSNNPERRLLITNTRNCDAREMELVGELIKYLNQHFEVNGMNATDSVSWSIFAVLEQLGCEEAIKGFIKAQSNPNERLQSLATDTLKGLEII